MEPLTAGIATAIAAVATQLGSTIFGWPHACAVVVFCIGTGSLFRWILCPKDPLMELAAGIKGAPPAELQARAARIAARKAVARPPPTQEEQLELLDTTPATRYQVDDPEWLEHLDREGFAVVADIANTEELQKAEKLLWDFLEANTTWQRKEPQSWTDEGMEKIGSCHNGLTNGAGIGQSDFMWHLRILPKIRSTFEKIWESAELIVSFDGAGIFRPWHHGFKKTVCGWWHVDQGRGKQGRHAVQGLVSLYDASAKTGGLTVVPGSHLRHPEVVEDQQSVETDYCTVQPHSAILQEMPQRLVSCKAGDLVLWDSRTVHANAPAPGQPDCPADRLLRAAAYICMTPKKFASADILKGRRSAYEMWYSTSHWPHKLDLGSCRPAPPRSFTDAPPAVAALIG